MSKNRIDHSREGNEIPHFEDTIALSNRKPGLIPNGEWVDIIIRNTECRVKHQEGQDTGTYS